MALRVSKKRYRKQPDDPKVLKKARKAVDTVLEAEDFIGNVGGKKQTDYRPEYAPLASIIVGVYGSTPSELAKVFGVKPPIIAMWINRHADFRDAIENATRNCNIRVMDRLFRQCMGYKFKTERLFYDGRRGKIVKGTYTETKQPETQAMIFWLKNRMPDKWQDKTAIGVDGGKLAEELKKVFDQEVTADVALDTYQKLLEIENQAVQVEPEEVSFASKTIFKQKRPKAQVEKASVTDAEVLSD
jgi:hypothetical protein